MEAASTGPADTSSSSECFFIVIGHHLMSQMVIEDQIDVIVNAFGSCELTILAIGGGGEGYYTTKEAAMGISSIRRLVSQLESRLSILRQEPTLCLPQSHSMEHGTSIVANPGQKGGGQNNGGGAGYSGGRQYSDGDGDYTGGSDGSDGGGSKGGSGDHEDISEYIFITWQLTPGDGGSPNGGLFGNYGEGGGGVMVDESGPETNDYKGQGYGGGGGTSPTGLPELVLLEISSG